MKHTLQLLILFSLIGLFENCSKKKSDISPINPIADFSYEIKDWTVVTFTNKSENATKYLWDFGDGQTSIEKDPVHTYIKAGEYKVKLTAESIDGNKSTKILDVIIIDKALDARFTLNASSYEPCIMNFKNESTAKAQYFEWDFGDGLYSSDEKTPTHIYLFGGTYTITFTIRDASSKILAQNKQQIVVKETFLPKANKTTIISRVKRAADKSIIGRDTTTIVYNDLDKIAFARVRNGWTIGSSLLTFDYSKTEPKCILYLPYSYTLSDTKLNNKGYLTEINQTYMNGKIGHKVLYVYDENDYIKQIDINYPSGGSDTNYFRNIGNNITEEISTAGFGFEYEPSTELNTLPMGFLFYVTYSTDNLGFFISYFNAKPYKNFIKSVTLNAITKTEFTYTKDSQGRVIRVIATNLSDRSTVETSISYQ